LPERADLLESYRSFSGEGRRHARANRASGDDDPEVDGGVDPGAPPGKHAE